MKTKQTAIQDMVVKLSRGDYVGVDRAPNGHLDIWYYSSDGSYSNGLAGEARWLPSKGCVDRDVRTFTDKEWAEVTGSIRAADSIGQDDKPSKRQLSLFEDVV